MESNGEFPIRLILLILLLLIAWKVAEAVAAMITAFIEGLMIIALVGASLTAAYLIFSFIRDRETQQNKKIRKVNKLSKELKNTLKNTPRHMHTELKNYFEQKQKEVYADKPSSWVDDMLDRTKQVFSIFKGGKNGNKNSHR